MRQIDLHAQLALHPSHAVLHTARRSLEHQARKRSTAAESSCTIRLAHHSFSWHASPSSALPPNSQTEHQRQLLLLSSPPRQSSSSVPRVEHSQGQPSRDRSHGSAPAPTKWQPGTHSNIRQPRNKRHSDRSRISPTGSPSAVQRRSSRSTAETQANPGRTQCARCCRARHHSHTRQATVCGQGWRHANKACKACS